MGISTIGRQPSVEFIAGNKEINASPNKSGISKSVHQVGNTSVYAGKLKRTLDVYGIDNNTAKLQKELSALGGSVVHVLAKNNLAGGVYLSHPEVDGYGNFNWMDAGRFGKNQQSPVMRVALKDLAELKKISDHYAKTPLPSFLYDIMSGKPCPDTDLYRSNPALLKYVPPVQGGDYAVLIRPNTPYISKGAIHLYRESPQKLKDNMDGIVLCSYVIPKGIKIDSSEAKNMPSDLDLASIDPATPQTEIDKITNIASLTSILDLTQEHVPMLENMKRETLNHLQQVYGANENEGVKMFFHFPVAPETATLHLHTRVNRGDHPLNSPRDFPLDDVIAHLKNNGNMSDLVLGENGKAYYAPASDPMGKIPEIPKSEVPNAFHLPLA